MANTVTYLGPSDRTDGTELVRVEKLEFPKGQAVEDVPDKVVKTLQGLKGHRFEVDSGKAPKDGEK